MVMLSLLVAMFTAFWTVMILLVVQGEMRIPASDWLGILLFVLALVLVGALSWRTVVKWLELSKESFSNSAWYRLRRFAAANRLRFFTNAGDPNFPGVLFGSGVGVRRFEHLRAAEGDEFEYGNMGKKDSEARKSGHTDGAYLAIRLETALPTVALAAKRSSTFFRTSALRDLYNNEELSLDGDYSKRFTLYCPVGDEREVLNIFTPDLLKLFVDGRSSFSVEIVDNWLFAYRTKRLDLRNPGIHRRLLKIIDIIAEKGLSHTDRYREERPGSLRERGGTTASRRLMTTLSVSGVVLLMLATALPIISAFTGD